MSKFGKGSFETAPCKMNPEVCRPHLVYALPADAVGELVRLDAQLRRGTGCLLLFMFL